MAERPRVHVVAATRDHARPDACAALRLIGPLSHPTVSDGFEVSFGPALPAGRLDVLAMQRSGGVDNVPDLVRTAKRRGARLIYDIDDNLLDTHPDPATEREVAPHRRTVRFLLREAHLVTTSTENLRSRVARLARAVEVLPNALDERQLRPGRPKRRNHRLRIGYFGTLTHLRDLMMVLGPLRAALSGLERQATVVLCGISPDPRVAALFDGFAQVEHLPVTGDYASFLALMRAHGDWDIGLAPLATGPFEIMKSDIKYLDYAGFGIAGLYSAHPAYASVQDGVTGLVARPEQWKDALLRLAGDEALRASVASAARRDLLAHRTLAVTGQHRAALLHRTLGTRQ
jgi:glycosyltransferase involved in cell wall biosynthesis